MAALGKLLRCSSFGANTKFLRLWCSAPLLHMAFGHTRAREAKLSRGKSFTGKNEMCVLCTEYVTCSDILWTQLSMRKGPEALELWCCVNHVCEASIKTQTDKMKAKRIN